MAIITFDGGQSSTATNSQSTTYLAQKVIQQLPAAPDTLVQSVLQDVLREFYSKSTAWRENVGPYYMVTGQDTIYLNPIDQYTELTNVLYAFIYPGVNGGNSPQRLNPAVRKIFGNDSNIPYSFFMEKPSKMILYPVPDKNYGQQGILLYVYGILRPVINTPQLPEIAITHHADALMWGTMARLMRMPKRPWFEKDLANMYQKMYVREIVRFRDEANRAYAGVDTPFKFPSFAGRYSQMAPRSVG
jgi:hypothetical protein